MPVRCLRKDIRKARRAVAFGGRALPFVSPSSAEVGRVDVTGSRFKVDEDREQAKRRAMAVGVAKVRRRPIGMISLDLG